MKIIVEYTAVETNNLLLNHAALAKALKHRGAKIFTMHYKDPGHKTVEVKMTPKLITIEEDGKRRNWPITQKDINS